MKKIILLLSLFIYLASSAQKEIEIPLKQGKNGIYILLSNKGFSDKNPMYGKYTKVVIKRAIDDNKFKEIGKMTAALSANEFEEIIAKDALLSIAKLKKLQSKEEAWKYVQSHNDLKDYGILALDINLGVALGAYFLDKDISSIKQGSLIKYKIILSNDKEQQELSASTSKEETADLQKPFLLNKFESDSLIKIQWATLYPKSKEAIYGNVYVKMGNPAEFKFIQRVFANKDENSDTVRYTLMHVVKPETQFQYYIRPATIAIHEGPASDTIIATSVNFTTLEQATNLSAKDTSNGIYLSWNLSHPSKATKSVIIERTADMNKPFITIAILPTTVSNYTDTKTQASFTYYYRIRIATISNTVLPPSSHIAAKHNPSNRSPLAPKSVTTQISNNTVIVTWSKVLDADIAGYFVSRNNGIDSIFEPISLLIKDTTFVDTSKLYGRNNYTYAVCTFTNNNMSSDWTYSASIRMNNNVLPLAPEGIRSNAQPGINILNWNDLKMKDAYISYYNIYRKNGNLNANNLTTSKDLIKEGFQLIATSSSNSFSDENIKDNILHYAITATDIFGNESNIGFIQTMNCIMPYIATPEQFSVRKTSKGVVIDWDITQQEGAKSYEIYKRNISENNPLKLTVVDIAKGSFLDSDVKKETVYFYSIIAKGQYGISDRSAEKFVKY